MAITLLEQDTVSRGFTAAKKVLRDIHPLLHELNVIYDSAGGVKETLTQAELDSVSGFSGITKAQLDDGMYALTTTLKAAIDGAYAQLAELAARDS